MDKLTELRNQIDQIHLDLADLLCQRLKVAEDIWSLKKSQNIQMTDPDRENQLLSLFDQNTNYTDAEKKFLSAVFEKTILETKKYLNEKK